MNNESKRALPIPVTKIWGHTEAIFNRNNVEVHRISVRQGGYCSKHWHKYKHNLFHVERGRLKITTWPVVKASPLKHASRDGRVEIVIRHTGEATPVVHILGAGMELSVAPSILHRFEAEADTIAYEIYWAELDDDIYRMESGGMRDA